MNSATWNSFVHVMMPVVLLGGPAVLLWSGWYRWRRQRRAGGPGGEDLPRHAPAPVRIARLTETLVLSALGLVIFALIATETHTNGMLLRLDELPATIATRQKAAALIVGAIFLILLLLAALGRAGAAACLMIIVFIGYGLLLNGSDWARPSRGGRTIAGPINYTIQIINANVVGADLWVNGIYLGKTPVEVTLEEFHRKVPYWPDAPSNDSPIAETQYRQTRSHVTRHPRWMRMRVPKLPDSASNGNFARYYAYVEFNGDVAIQDGGNGAGMSTTRGTADSQLEVAFPQRAQRLEALLDQARLADYQPASAWFEAIETYDEDAWLALRRTAEREPAMMDVLDQWARWRYDLDRIDDTASAWRAFERVLDDVKQRKQYITAGVAGRATELLVPHLDPAQLAARAEPMIERIGSYELFTFELDGRFHFGVTNRRDWPSVDGATTSMYRAWGPGDQLPVTGAALAHAIWRLDAHLDAQTTKPNALEMRINPALIRHARTAGNPDVPLQLALRLGGPVIEKFLLRMTAWQDLRSEHWDDQIRLDGGAEVNRWLYLAAHLPGQSGERFHQAHHELILTMTDRIFEGQVRMRAKPARYLFLDLERGDDSLARQYWPRLQKVLDKESLQYDALEISWRYLLRMEPVSTVSMYHDAWARYEGEDTKKRDSLALLDALPAGKRDALVKQLREQVRRATTGTEREYLLRELDAVGQRSLEAEASRLMVQLRAGELTAKQRDNLINWLTHEAPHHPLVRLLAESDRPALREMAVRPLTAHPTPAHQRLLQQLAHDTAPNPRTAAVHAIKQLQAQSNKPPHNFAADAGISESTTTQPPPAP